MIKRLLLGLLFCSLSLFAQYASSPQDLATMQGDSSALVCGLVNAITGDLVIEQADIVVCGAQSLPIMRKQTSRESANPYNAEVLYHKETNTVMHFRYGRASLGPLKKISKS
ncbi:MAG: hypothetical protein P0S96_01195 [Simkaniaceae bacterium]|nr:hypothetical protein [Candidatus Sacchlamyda saccharinae]